MPRWPRLPGGRRWPPRLLEPVSLKDADTERVRLKVEITARRGQYRSGVAAAAERLTPSEAAIIADVEDHGLDVQQLHPRTGWRRR